MEYVEIKDIKYRFVRDFKHNNDIRISFNRMTETIFGFSLEDWYQDGQWADYYIPYSLMHNQQVISNVSINKIEFDISNERKVGIQIGTVMSDERYRNKGLNKYILDRIIDEWKDQSDFIYLFANDSVLEFYPKFNFEKTDEFQYSKHLNNHTKSSKLKQLNPTYKADAAFIIETINNSLPISQIAMRNNPSLVMFYCLNFMKDQFFYIEKYKAIIAIDINGETLKLIDVFSKEAIDLNALISSISDEGIKKVILGFTPLDTSGFEKRLVSEGDTLFIYKDDKASFFKENQRMFPELSHA